MIIVTKLRADCQKEIHEIVRSKSSHLARLYYVWKVLR